MRGALRWVLRFLEAASVGIWTVSKAECEANPLALSVDFC